MTHEQLHHPVGATNLEFLKTVPDYVVQSIAERVEEWWWEPCRGGLSGARLWRGVDSSGNIQVALKCWSADVTPSHLTQVHRWMEHVSHLPYIPKVHRWSNGKTVLQYQGRCWDLTRWQPGRAREQPTLQEVALACCAVGQLHRAWPMEGYGVCPAVAARWHWLSRWRSKPRVSHTLFRRYHPWECTLRRAEQILCEHVEPILEQLQPWTRREGPLQVCIRDLRAEHVLYREPEDAQTISGIVDFGAAQIDHPAVDLARLLGDYASFQPARSTEIFTVGLQAYESAGGHLGVWASCVPLLSQAGSLASVIRWLDRLEENATLPVTAELVFQRVRELLRRWW